MSIRTFESQLHHYCWSPPSPIFACHDGTFLCAVTASDSSKCERKLQPHTHTHKRGGRHTQDLSALTENELQSLSRLLPVFSSPVLFETAFEASIANVPNRLPLLMSQHYEFLLCAFLSAPRRPRWNLIGSVGGGSGGISLFVLFLSR